MTDAMYNQIHLIMDKWISQKTADLPKSDKCWALQCHDGNGVFLCQKLGNSHDGRLPMKKGKPGRFGDSGNLAENHRIVGNGKATKVSHNGEWLTPSRVVLATIPDQGHSWIPAQASLVGGNSEARLCGNCWTLHDWASHYFGGLSSNSKARVFHYSDDLSCQFSCQHNRQMFEHLTFSGNNAGNFVENGKSAKNHKLLLHPVGQQKTDPMMGRVTSAGESYAHTKANVCITTHVVEIFPPHEGKPLMDKCPQAVAMKRRLAARGIAVLGNISENGNCGTPHEWNCGTFCGNCGTSEARLGHNSVLGLAFGLVQNYLYPQSQHYRQNTYSLIRGTIRKFPIVAALGLYGMGKVTEIIRKLNQLNLGIKPLAPRRASGSVGPRRPTGLKVKQGNYQERCTSQVGNQAWLYHAGRG